MATFDQEFAKLQARLTAALAVVAKYPEIAAEVREAIDGAQTAAEIQAGIAADDARANAISTLLSTAGDVLAQATAPAGGTGASG